MDVYSSSSVDFSDDLSRSCLLDLGSEPLKAWGGTQSNAVDNLTSVLEDSSSKGRLFESRKTR